MFCISPSYFALSKAKYDENTGRYIKVENHDEKKQKTTKNLEAAMLDLAKTLPPDGAGESALGPTGKLLSLRIKSRSLVKHKIAPRADLDQISIKSGSW